MSEDARVSATEATAASCAERATSDERVNRDPSSDSRGSDSDSDNDSGSREAIPRVARHSAGRKKRYDDDDKDNPDLSFKRVRAGVKGDGRGGSGSSGGSCDNGSSSIGGGRGGRSLAFPI